MKYSQKTFCHKAQLLQGHSCLLLVKICRKNLVMEQEKAYMWDSIAPLIQCVREFLWGRKVSASGNLVLIYLILSGS